jgi:hypothetical protein
LLQQLGAVNNLVFAPRMRRELLQMLPVNEEILNEPEAAEMDRIRELELQLEIEKEKNKQQTFSFFGSLQGGFKVYTSKFYSVIRFLLDFFI